MEKYSLSMRINHWLVAVLYVGLLTLGLYMTTLPNTDPDRITYYGLHKSFGVIALVAIVWRLINRFVAKIPSYEYNSALISFLSKLGHFLLYLFMVIMPFSGYLMSMMSAKGINFFGYTLPNWPGANKQMAVFFHEIHTLLPWFFIALIALHILAWPYHYYKDRMNIINRII